MHTKIRPTMPAIVAFPTRPARLNHYSLTDMPSFHPLSNFRYGAHDLMAKN
jgi:hypothetical protein